MKTDYKNRTAIILKGKIEHENSTEWLSWFQFSKHLFESLVLPVTHYGVDGDDFRKVTGIRTAKRFEKKIYNSLLENHKIEYLELYHYPENSLTIYPKNCLLYLSRHNDKTRNIGDIFFEFLSESISDDIIDTLIDHLSKYIILTSGEVVECRSSYELLVNRLTNTYSEDESKNIFNVRKTIP